MEYWGERKGLVSRLTVLLLKIRHQKINLRFSCCMYWRVSCKIVAKNQNHQIIGGSNPSASFQVQERGCHVVCFLCSLGMSSSLLVKTTVKTTMCCGSHINESRRACLFSKRRKTDTTSMQWYFTRTKNC